MRNILGKLSAFIILIAHSNNVFSSNYYKIDSFDIPITIPASQVLKNPPVSEDIQDKDKVFYPGFTFDSRIENIGVESYLSLGGKYAKKVSEAIERSDQFVVCFMYRFNHPQVIQALAHKFIEVRDQLSDCITLVFLDDNPFHTENSFSRYKSSVRYLSRNVPLSFVKLQKEGTKSDKSGFHHKIIICKRRGERAITFIGSANATHEADNQHSEDTLLIQSNALAGVFLNQFREFFQTKTLRVFDENRFKTVKTNRSYLEDCINLIENAKEEKLILPRYNLGYKGHIESLAISNFRDANPENSCLELIKHDILNQNNQLVIYFQNFFNVYSEQEKKNSFSEVRQSLESDKLKLIVRWEYFSEEGNKKRTEKPQSQRKQKQQEALKKQAEREIKYFEQVEDKNYGNFHFINFRPYTRGKFHHKTIIQYPLEGEPILYTGSFNFSENAILNNSENIIGVRSKELVEDYLCSLLWNSDLADHQKIWVFFNQKISRHLFKLDDESSKIYSLASNVLSRCKNNITKYNFRVDSFIDRLIASLTYTTVSEKNKKKLQDYKDLFKNSENIDRVKTLITIKDDILGILSEGTIGSDIRQWIYNQFEEILDFNKSGERELLLLENEQDTIRKINNLSKLIDHTWIDLVKDIRNDIKVKTIESVSSSHNKETIRLIKNMREGILNIANCINDFLILPNSLSTLCQLKTTLEKIIDKEKNIEFSLEDRIVPKIKPTFELSIEEDSMENDQDLEHLQEKKKGLKRKISKKKKTNEDGSSENENRDSKHKSEESSESPLVQNTKILKGHITPDTISSKSKGNLYLGKNENPKKTKKKSLSSSSNEEEQETLLDELKIYNRAIPNFSGKTNFSKKNTSPKKQEAKKIKEPIDDFDVKIGPYLEQFNQNFDYLEPKTKNKLKKLGITQKILTSKEKLKEKWKNYNQAQKDRIENIIKKEHNPV
ncbi:MAG: hypothetical protein JNK42_02700 [Caedimonas sp.]|nr:hypothetical protein [Caedimonas sp.]